MRGARGLSLVEVIFVMGLTGLFFILVGRLVVTIVPAQQQMRGEVQRLRQTTTLAARMGRELRTSPLMYWPNGNWTTHSPDLGANGPLMFMKNRRPGDPMQGHVVSYWYVPTEMKVYRLAYRKINFVFGDLSTYLPLPSEDPVGRALAEEVESFTLSRYIENNAEMVRIELKVEGVPDPVTNTARLLPAPGL